MTAVLVVHDGAVWLKECLDALSLQTRPLDRLVVVDTGSTDDSARIVEKHARIRQVASDVAAISAPAESTFGQAVRRAVEWTAVERMAYEAIAADTSAPEQLTPGSGAGEAPASHPARSGTEWLWLLHDDSAAAPDALAHLLDAARRSPSVGVAGPKLVTWDDPSRLLEVGSVVTRSGRRVGGPAAGERDQGQHDNRSDVLGVSTSGMLIRREVFETLGGFDPAFGQSCDGLDLCWRAQLAGHRVVVAPRARIREAAASANGQRSSDLSPEAARRGDRRSCRQVALARCSLFAAPFLAIWIALASLGSAVALLVAKRPAGARTALSDLGVLMTPWRPLAARRRSRGLRRVRRRDLRGLFASPRVAFGYTLDTIREGASWAGTGSGRAGTADDSERSARSLETGPAAEDAESLEQPSRGAVSQIAGHPGFVAVMAATLLAVVTWRSLLGAVLPGRRGVVGGELLPVSGSASELWHGWLDGWHGAGLGNALEPAPYLPVLSAGAWVVEHLPVIGSATSPVAVAIAWLLFAAIPLSAWTAYLAARVVTLAPWPRAWAALAWASLATLTTAVAGGRLGAVVAHIVLPLVAAGFVCAARRSAPSWPTFGAALKLAVLAAFNPVLGTVGAVAALVLLVVGHGRTRVLATVLLLVPIGLLGPWILQVVHHPLMLLAGPGLTVWSGASVAPWRLELLHPGGPGSYPALLSAPIVLAGLLAMSRREAGSRWPAVLAVLAAGGLFLGVAAPHVVIGLIPPDLAGAGGAITGWSGTGLDLAGLALIAAALRGYVMGPRRLFPFRFHWRELLVPAVAAAAVLAVVASMAMIGWVGLGATLTRQVPSTPAVAADQAHGPLGNRLLVIARERDAIGYRLVGAEPGPLARDLPGALPAVDPLLADAVKSTLGTGEPKSVNAARDALSDLGVGFVTFEGAPSDPLVSQLDATAGLTRLGGGDARNLWRVLRRANSLGSSRLRLTDATGTPLASVTVTGDNGRTEAGIGPAGARGSTTPETVSERRLVVAEPQQWAQHARVLFAGRPLTALAGGQQPTYLLPSTAGQLQISVPPSHQRWRWSQLGLLIVVLFLAAPFGSTRPRTR